LLGTRVRERDSVIGVVMAFGLGLGVLFIALYGRTGTGFNLLTGQAVNAGAKGVVAVVITTVVVVAVMSVIYRPLLFASTDPRVAEARGVPMKLLSVVFAVLLGAAVAQSVQIIGALLVMSLLITPAAAAMRISSNPTVVLGLSILFGVVAAVGGIILSLAPALPPSVFVTTISFAIYLVCRVVGTRRSRTSGRRRVPTTRSLLTSGA
jgi:zinc/manganese transport system permease protein